MKLLKIFLVISIVILIILLVFGFVLSLDWPWWVAFFILMAILGLCIGFLFLRKILLRRREQIFVQEVINQDEYHLNTLKGKEKDERKELQDKWKEAVEALRRSHLRKYGNPLYVLPWYLVIGESGSGKTTAINSARLSSPFAEAGRTSGISGTRNCDWWFFEQAIILDTAGRWTIPIDEGRDKEEWKRFLDLLKKYRKREPINGVSVTISADKLLEASPGTLEEDGRNVRRRVDELMRVLGFKFPVYVLVTKCDLIQGMNEFCDYLPEKGLDQPMGLINQDLSTDVIDFQKRTFDTIDERLRNLRLLLLQQRESGGADPGVLLFPEEFKNLQKGLESFLKVAFEENPYQESSILRGLFFCSGKQEGTPFSHFLNALGMIGEREVLPGTNKGLFLHDFFSIILPKDRRLFAPTRGAIEWNTLTRNLGLASWIILGTAICGMLSFSFVKNLKTLRAASHEFVKPPVFHGEFMDDLITMDRIEKAILNLEDENNNWWIPRFGLRESIYVENGFKEKYCRQFQRLLVPFDRQLAGIAANFTGSTPDGILGQDEVFGQYVAHIVRRINLLKVRLEGDNFERLQKKPQPSYVTLLYPSDQSIHPEVRQKFGYLYLYYLTWRMDTKEIKNEMNILQQRLRNLLKLRGINARWITAWVDKQETIPYLTLKDFWGGSSPASDETAITPAFSREGKELIDSFFKEIESALSGPLFLADQKIEFEKWYRKVCFSKWKDFGAIFPKGSKRLRSREEWQQVAAKMATNQGPYFAFLNKIALDLEPLTEGESLPPWLQQVYQFQMVKRRAAAEIGTLSKAAEKGKTLISKIERKFGKEVKVGSASQFLTASAYQEYQKALAAIAQTSASRNQAYQMASQIFKEDSATSESPFSAAFRAANKLEANMMREKPAEDVFWELIKGPLDYLWKLARMETACYLQTQWEEKVLSETQGFTDQEAVDFLLERDGPVWKFLEGPAKPFIGWRDKRGYYAKKVETLGGVIPFELPLFLFLNKAKAPKIPKNNYRVTIKGLPTDTNPEVRLKPHGTRLELQCAGSTESLINLHYTVSKTFNWSSETCSDVILRIDVGDISLVKQYEGSQAFPNFLLDFPGGQRSFYPHEFPEEQEYLESLGIKFIKVNYDFSGHYQDVLELFKHRPEEVQRSIAWCWGQ